MRFFHLKRPRATAHRSNLYPVYAVIALGLALVIALGVVSAIMVRRSKTLEGGYNTLTAHIQTDLNMVLRTFSQAGLPNAELQSDIIPNMRLYLYAADSFNEVLIDMYGQNAAVVDDALNQQITLQLDEIERLIKTGLSTQDALAKLTGYMAQLEADMASKFAYNNLLLPQTARR
jgi:hypothetical protein